MATLETITQSRTVISFAGDPPLDNETIVIGGKTYTFQDSLTDVDGNVRTGPAVNPGVLNLAEAVNLDPAGAGIRYAVSMTANSLVYAMRSSELASRLEVFALLPGAIDGAFNLVEAGTAGFVVEEAQTSGEGNFHLWMEYFITHNQLNAEVLAGLMQLTNG